MRKGKVKPIPDGYHSATPYLIVDGAATALVFYKKAFGATERMRMPGPGGKVGHAEMSIGDSVIMLADEHPEMGALGPRVFGGAAVSLHLYVSNVDVTVKKAVAAGAKLLRPGGGHGAGGPGPRHPSAHLPGGPRRRDPAGRTDAGGPPRRVRGPG
jgi:uncharacterized glyoxalase superfamily protein PhnB